MPLAEEFVEIVLEMKAKKYLGPHYLAMTDEECLKTLEDRLRERVKAGEISTALRDELSPDDGSLTEKEAKMTKKPKAYHASIIVNGVRIGTRASTPHELAENLEKRRRILLERFERQEN